MASALPDVDALPYIDYAYTDTNEKQQVEQLVADEMKTFQPPADGYLSYLPPVYLSC